MIDIVITVNVGDLWVRRNGVVYRIADERIEEEYDQRYVLLVPYSVPDGQKARKSWKWDQAVAVEMDKIE